MTILFNLLEQQGVDLGEGYKRIWLVLHYFVEFIAEDLCQVLQKHKFVSLQMDGSTDAANIEEEIFLSTYLDVSDSGGALHVRNNYLCIFNNLKVLRYFKV